MGGPTKGIRRKFCLVVVVNSEGCAIVLVECQVGGILLCWLCVCPGPSAGHVACSQSVQCIVQVIRSRLPLHCCTRCAQVRPGCWKSTHLSTHSLIQVYSFTTGPLGAARIPAGPLSPHCLSTAREGSGHLYWIGLAIGPPFLSRLIACQ